MAEPIVSFVLETIGTLLNEERKFLCGVSEQAEQLHSELQMMRALLRDADEKQNDSATVKEWVSQSKELAYEAENVLETHTFKLASRRRGEGARKVIRRYACILNECHIHHKFGLEIQSLNTRISNLTRRFQEYGIRAVTENEGSSSSNKLQQLRMTYPYASDDDDFVGFEKDIQKLVRALLNEDGDSKGQYYGVVSICGMGGSGKTTLARKVYNHPDVKHHFDSFAWVCISQKWQRKDILQGILAGLLQMKKGEIEKWRDEEIVEQLIRIQRERKCLMVLDDIWSNDAWDCINVTFPMRSKGTKILLTTRKKDVASHIGPNGFHHEPRLLSNDECWELLQKKAFRGQSNRGSAGIHNLEELGKEMVKSCGGLPLAVVVLGGILATKHSPHEWNEVGKNFTSYMGKGKSMEQQQEGEVQKILALSYHDLPYKLKPCCLYLSAFPEDEDIDTEDLYLLWIAEGMVFAEDKTGEESMMEIADRYLGELVNRCIVRGKVVDFGPSLRKFEYCQLHDLMRDFCLEKAREEKFLEVRDINYDNQQGRYMDVESTNSSFSSKSHRIWIYHSVDPLIEAETVFAPSQVEITCHELVRTLALHGKGAPLPDYRLNRYKMLRSLTIQGMIATSAGKLPIGNLHLRYLNLRRSTLFISPSSISNLEHLEALDLREANIKWTKNISMPLRMRRLRYLDICAIAENYHSQFDVSSNLETLRFSESTVARITHFSDLTALRELEASLSIENALALEETIKYISNSQTLKYASIEADIGSHPGASILTAHLFTSRSLQYLDVWGYLGKSLPMYNSNSLRNILELKLGYCYLEEDPMEMLEKLPKLQKLWLRGAFDGKEMVCHSMGFPHLVFLYLFSLRQLEKWTVEKGAMPCLSHLEIEYCEKLVIPVEELNLIASLQQIKTDNPQEKV